MTTFTIDTDNNITAHAVAPTAQDTLAAFASQKGLSKVAAEWPINRLVEVWNSFAGTPGFDDLKPVKKFENRTKATTRIWTAIQKLEAAPPTLAPAKQRAAKVAPAKPRAAKSTRGNRHAPMPAPYASSRAFSKQAIVRDMLLRAGGATLHEIMAETGWQAHSVRGFISTLAKKTGVEITSTRRESDQARVYEATK